MRPSSVEDSSAVRVSSGSGVKSGVLDSKRLMRLFECKWGACLGGGEGDFSPFARLSGCISASAASLGMTLGCSWGWDEEG